MLVSSTATPAITSLIGRHVTATAASAEALLARTLADTLVGSFGLECMVGFFALPSEYFSFV